MIAYFLGNITAKKNYKNVLSVNVAYVESYRNQRYVVFLQTVCNNEGEINTGGQVNATIQLLHTVMHLLTGLVGKNRTSEYYTAGLFKHGGFPHVTAAIWNGTNNSLNVVL